MEEYPLEIVDDHMVVTLDGKKFLLDTGAPASIGNVETLQLLSTDHELSSSYLGLTVSQLSEFIGTSIDVLAGADILGKVYFLIDWQKKKVVFSVGPIAFEGASIPTEQFMGVPIVGLEVSGKGIRAFLDTGAKLSYLDSEITDAYQSIGTAADFYPSIGNFSTTIFEIPITIGGKSFEVRVGNLPPLLQMTLMMAGTEGILGNDIYKLFDVYFALPESKIVLRKSQ